MRRVFVEFATNTYNVQNSLNVNSSKTISSSVTILHYDRLYQIIIEEIENINPSKPALVSWLKDNDKAKAVQELREIPNISSIADPFGMVEPQYSEVNIDYFYKHPKTASEMEAPTSSSDSFMKSYRSYEYSTFTRRV